MMWPNVHSACWPSLLTNYIMLQTSAKGLTYRASCIRATWWLANIQMFSSTEFPILKQNLHRSHTFYSVKIASLQIYDPLSGQHLESHLEMAMQLVHKASTADVLRCVQMKLFPIPKSRTKECVSLFIMLLFHSARNSMLVSRWNSRSSLLSQLLSIVCSVLRGMHNCCMA